VWYGDWRRNKFNNKGNTRKSLFRTPHLLCIHTDEVWTPMFASVTSTRRLKVVSFRRWDRLPVGVESSQRHHTGRWCGWFNVTSAATSIHGGDLTTCRDAEISRRDSGTWITWIGYFVAIRISCANRFIFGFPRQFSVFFLSTCGGLNLAGQLSLLSLSYALFYCIVSLLTISSNVYRSAASSSVQRTLTSLVVVQWRIGGSTCHPLQQLLTNAMSTARRLDNAPVSSSTVASRAARKQTLVSVAHTSIAASHPTTCDYWLRSW